MHHRIPVARHRGQDGHNPLPLLKTILWLGSIAIGLNIWLVTDSTL